MGDKGCLSLFGCKAACGERSRTVQHRLLAEHLTAEYHVHTEGRGPTVDEWKLPAHKPDNQWFDSLVGCTAAASMQGAVLSGTRGEHAAERRPIRLSELQRSR
jgi:hypothetical protein